MRTRLDLGTAARPVGVLPFQAHRPYTPPKMLVVSVEPDGRWFVSFCFESVLPQEPELLRSPEELAYEYGQHPGLEALTVGIDRGVALPLAVSDGQTFELDPRSAAPAPNAPAPRQRGPDSSSVGCCPFCGRQHQCDVNSTTANRNRGLACLKKELSTSREARADGAEVNEHRP